MFAYANVLREVRIVELHVVVFDIVSWSLFRTIKRVCIKELLPTNIINNPLLSAVFYCIGSCRIHKCDLREGWHRT